MRRKSAAHLSAAHRSRPTTSWPSYGRFEAGRAAGVGSGDPVDSAAMTLISDDYRALQQALHRNPDYGVASTSFAPNVIRMVQRFGVRSVCDYGAGKQRLGEAL